MAKAVADRPEIEVNDSVRLGQHSAGSVTMTPAAWRRYNAALREVYSKFYADGGGRSAMHMVGF